MQSGLKKIGRLTVRSLSSSFFVFQESFKNFSTFINIYNFRIILFPILSLAYKEIISVLGFFWIWEKQYSIWFFIAYSLIGSTSSLLWGWWGDLRESKKDHESKYKLIIYADILLLFILLFLIFDIPKWIIILLAALVDTQSNARSTLATKKLLCREGHYHEKSLFLNKLCWTVIFLSWAFFNVIKGHQKIFVLSVFIASLLVFFIYPKKLVRKEGLKSENHEKSQLSPRKRKALYLMLVPFASFEAIFFLLWSFSEGTHAPINFFPLTGGACLIGNVLSFFSGKDKELRIIRHMYLSVFCLTIVSFLVLHYFPYKETMFIVYAAIAMLGVIYLPYIFDETMRIYGRHKRGEAAGLVEIFSASGDIIGSVVAKFLTQFVMISAVASVFALIGYFITALGEIKPKKHLE
jgi:hypothetical protein